jgi:subtilisin family serine protease
MSAIGFEAMRTLARKGFTGDEMILTVLDTGLDGRQSFFADDGHPLLFNVIDCSHRNIVMYETFSDSADDANGHGTYITSIAMGSSLGKNMTLHNGIAPGAKVHLINVSHQGSGTVESYPVTKLLAEMQKTGSFVVAGCWGTSLAPFLT